MAGEPVVAVLDTSVLYGNISRRALVEAIRQGRFDGVWSPHIIGELYRVLTIRWVRTHGFDAASLADLSRASKNMMDVLVSALQLVDTGPSADESLDALDDADDFHLIRAARRTGASFVVSANTHDFPSPNAQGRHVFEGVEFIECAPFLDRIGMTSPS
jgi:predicted nucleic acid-binding protein